MIDQQLSDSEKVKLQAIKNSRKYRDLAIPDETVESLYQQALLNGNAPRVALKSVRQKLHNIVASYLGETNFEEAAGDLDAAFKEGVDNEIKSVCTRILETHASTRERLGIMETFYSQLFSLTGRPRSILDLACGLNPFAFPWMGLPNSIRFHAFDLNLPRIELINHFFRLEGLAPLAVHQDILIHPPTIQADVAFLFKEAHRLEQRHRGCNRALWHQLQVRWLLVSLPTSSLSGKHDLLGKHRRLVEQTCSGQSWTINEIMFTNEIVFCIDKGTA